MAKINELFNLTEEQKKKTSEDLFVRSVKRHLKEKYDSALSKKYELEKELDAIHKNIATTYDFNEVGKRKFKLNGIETEMKLVQEEYKYLFDQELKVEE